MLFHDKFEVHNICTVNIYTTGYTKTLTSSHIRQSHSVHEQKSRFVMHFSLEGQQLLCLQCLPDTRDIINTSQWQAPIVTANANVTRSLCMYASSDEDNEDWSAMNESKVNDVDHGQMGYTSTEFPVCLVKGVVWIVMTTNIIETQKLKDNQDTRYNIFYCPLVYTSIHLLSKCLNGNKMTKAAI